MVGTQTAVVARRGETTPELAEVPRPDAAALGDDDVLCRTLELGICGTDREILQSAQPCTPPSCDYLVLGHECLARVEAVGANVTAWKVGDLVTPTVRRGLPSATRRPDFLPLGEFVERGIWSEHGFSAPWWLDKPQHLFGVPEEIRDIGVFTEPLAVVEKGVNEAQLLQRARLGKETWQDHRPRVLVTGMGPIGFAGVIAAVCHGWEVTMFGRDTRDSRRATLTERFGASYQPSQAWSFAMEDVEREGFDLVLECTGSDEVMVDAAQALRSCGVMVWLGSTRRPAPLRTGDGAVGPSVARMMRQGLLRNHLHVASVNAAPRDFRQALEHLAKLQHTHAAELKSLITSRVALSDSLSHFERRQAQGIKAVVTYDEASHNV